MKGISQLTDLQNTIRKKKWELYRRALAPNGKYLVDFIVRRGAFSVHGRLPSGAPEGSLVAT
eukprot:5426239-Heterocapsa_arctica.AAC.1